MRTLLLIGLVASIAAADVESGPKPGAEVAPLKVNLATGANEGKEVDLPADRKDAPTIYLFINSSKFSRPIGRLLKEVDGKLGETNAKAAAFAIWIGSDEKTKDYLPKVNESLKFTKTDLAWMKNATPEGWGLNDDAHLTVVVVKDKKVAKVFAFASTNETDAKKILDAAK